MPMPYDVPTRLERVGKMLAPAIMFYFLLNGIFPEYVTGGFIFGIAALMTLTGFALIAVGVISRDP